MPTIWQNLAVSRSTNRSELRDQYLSLAYCSASRQARSQVLRFGGAKYIFRGARILFLLYFWNKFFWEQENLGRHKRNLGVTAPECPPWLRACTTISNEQIEKSFKPTSIPKKIVAFQKFLKRPCQIRANIYAKWKRFIPNNNFFNQLMIFIRDWSIWYIDNFMKMPQLNRKYPSGTAKRRKKEGKIKAYEKWKVYWTAFAKIKLINTCFRKFIFLSKDLFFMFWVEKVRQISNFLWCCRLS